MSRSSGIGQLFKGILIGIVLLLAILGTLSILETEDGAPTQSNNTSGAISRSIPAPSIDIASAQTTNTTSSDINTSQQNDDKSNTVADTQFKPTLENEKVVETTPPQTKPEPEKPKEIQYGKLELGVIDPQTKQSLKADYVIYDDQDKVVSESKNTEGTSIKLPIGKYKVVTTLNKPKGLARESKAVETIKFVTVIANETSTNTFEVDPPPTTGILQVSAINASTGKPMRASFIVQKVNGETVGTRQNVPASLFKLKAGSYRVTVRSGNNSDIHTVVIEPGGSVQEVFKLQEAHFLGRLLIRIFDTRSNKPVRADIVIATRNGKVVHEFKAVTQTELSLTPANYQIRVTGPSGQSSKDIYVSAGQSISEIFRFNAPIEDIVDTENTNTEGTQITDDVRITAPNNTESEASNDPLKATVALFAVSDKNQRPLKSNFYIQTTNGQHIAKKIYANSAEFDLDPGTYRITVRSKDKSNIVKTIELFAGQKTKLNYALKSSGGNPPSLAPPKPAPTANNSPPKNTVIANGFLQVSMNPPRNTHFIVATSAGKKIVELTSVPRGNFKLDIGQYKVTAIHNAIRRSKNIKVNNRQTSRLVFDAGDFQRPQNNTAPPVITKGVLRSRIIDPSGRSLRGDLTVTNRQGQVVARANAVTVGTFNLLPGSHTVIVNYQGLRGTEKVNIIARETTIQTFTIAQDNTPPPQEPARKKSLEELFKERLEEELRKQF